MEVATRIAEQRVAEWASACAEELGIDPSRVQTSYVLNPGGFGNLSIHLTDGRTRLHVKLALPGKADRLRQWAKVSDYLAEHYAAPKLVCEMDREIVPGYPYGVVFEHIEHAVPLADALHPEAALTGILDTVAKLHRDDRLRRVLPQVGKRTCAQAFEGEYIYRFTGDLEGICDSRDLLRDFVSDETMGWFGEEIERLREAVSQTPAFQLPANDVVHNDLNGNNILTDGNGHFRIIDWDDLSGQGDAAMDYSVLLWPFTHDSSWPLLWKKVRLQAEDATLERLELYFRAKLFDDVLDVLADYVEAEWVPKHREAVQRKARSTHLQSYPQYLAKYGRGT